MAAGNIRTHARTSPIPEYLTGPGGVSYVHPETAWWKARWATWRGRAQGALLVLLLLFFTRWVLLFAAIAVAMMVTLSIFRGLRRYRHHTRQLRRERWNHRFQEHASAQFAQASATPETLEPDWDLESSREESALADFDRRLEEAAKQTVSAHAVAR